MGRQQGRIKAAAVAPAARRPVGVWLLAVAAMVFVMVILGGLTRLTGSGLSIVEWQPFALLPPLDAAAWQRAFEAYQASPQYKLVNEGMDLAGFKGIFWLEYIHRLWGRLIGFAFLIPFLRFVATRRLGWKDAPGLFALFILGGLQGGLGWFMVRSGLEVRPEVSHLRLAAHLFAALLLYAALIWAALGYLFERPGEGMSAEGGGPAATPEASSAERAVAGRRASAALKSLRRRLDVALGLIWITIPAGALVAGLHAGLIYNTFPMMGGTLLPGEAFDLAPWWRNFLDNPTLVQFDHRWLAIATFVAAIVAGLTARAVPLAPRAKLAAGLVPFAAILQLMLGIATLLTFVPLPLAALHQAGAFVLFTTLLWAVWETR